MATQAHRFLHEDRPPNRYLVACRCCGHEWEVETTCSREQIITERPPFSCPGCRKRARVRFVQPSRCDCGTELNAYNWSGVCGPCAAAEHRARVAQEQVERLTREERRVLWQLRRGPATSYALMLHVRLGWVRVERALATLERHEMARSEGAPGGRRLWRAVP